MIFFISISLKVVFDLIIQGDACTSCSFIDGGEGVAVPGPKGERGDPGPPGEGKPGKNVRELCIIFSYAALAPSAVNIADDQLMFSFQGKPGLPGVQGPAGPKGSQV